MGVVKDDSRYKGSPGWLFDERRGEWVQPASYEQKEFFDAHGYVDYIPGGGMKPIRMTIRQREWKRRPRQ